ncbi:MAG: MMPL family transporter [Acidimicrobiia bacterium]
MSLGPESIARASSRHPVRTLVIWLAILAVMVLLTFLFLNDVLTQEFDFSNRPESVRATELLDEKFPDRADDTDSVFYLIYSETTSVADPEFARRVAAVQLAVVSLGSEVIAEPPITYYDIAVPAPEQAAQLVSPTQAATLMPVELATTGEAVVDRLRQVAHAESVGGFTVEVAGNPVMEEDFTRLAEEDLRRGESIGIAAALIVLVVVFAALIAPLLPIVMGVASIAAALGLVSLIGQIGDVNLFVTNMISMIGLAVGIDYSLFIVSRYREERGHGWDKLDAIGVAGATANRAVFFSGLTVVLALVGMYIVPASLFRSLATGAILVTVCALAASMTLLPALVAMLGDRIDWPRRGRRPRGPSGQFWDRIARRVMARPVVFLLVAVLLMGALGSLYFQMEVGTAQNVSALPDGLESKRAFLAMERFFAGGLSDPARIVVSTNPAGGLAAAVADIQTAIAADPDFAPATTVEVSADGSTAAVSAYFRGDPASDAAFQAVRDLRSKTALEVVADHQGTVILVGGSTAFLTDFLDMTRTYQWVVLGFVLALSFVLLMVVFRSIVVPIKAILMNLLSVMAAYGAITLVFQMGVGIGFLNSIGFQFRQTDSIESWIPLFLFSVLFGLSMDYHVFLLSRIRERYDHTGDNAESVAYGLASTARIITGVALIMVAVFTGFASGRLGQLQQMGFGLAVAVFFDATIVRTIIVPASMRLLGKANWYLPRWLQWLPRINVEGGESLPPAPGRGLEPEPI